MGKKIQDMSREELMQLAVKAVSYSKDVDTQLEECRRALLLEQQQRAALEAEVERLSGLLNAAAEDGSKLELARQCSEKARLDAERAEQLMNKADEARTLAENMQQEVMKTKEQTEQLREQAKQQMEQAELAVSRLWDELQRRLDDYCEARSGLGDELNDIFGSAQINAAAMAEYLDGMQT